MILSNNKFLTLVFFIFFITMCVPPKDKSDASFAAEKAKLDSLRGVGEKLEGTNNENAAASTSTRLTSFDSDGFTVKTDPSVNGQTNQMCVWSWACNGGTNENAVSESGNNPANTRQTNTDAGFSIVKWVGNGTSGHTVPHHLGTTPQVVIMKNLVIRENDKKDGFF